MGGLPSIADFGMMAGLFAHIVRAPYSGEMLKKKAPKVIRSPVSGGSVNTGLNDNLREWRKSMARKRGLPAFRIFTNKVLDNLTSDLPTSNDELHMVNGVGPYFVKRYGKEIIRIIKTHLKQKK